MDKEMKIEGIKVRLERSAQANSTIPDKEWRLKYQADVNYLLKLIEPQDQEEEKPKRRKQ